MNGDQSAEPEKPPASEATEDSSSNGADSLAKKRKKDCLKPIITTESFEGDTESAKEDSKMGRSLFNVSIPSCTAGVSPFIWTN
ncbi:hypothetical protein E4U53_006999 [Claviceps sorghi]|nr:hypothetical protein E4U53_006999 [Claviceps sorghi]